MQGMRTPPPRGKGGGVPEGGGDRGYQGRWGGWRRRATESSAAMSHVNGLGPAVGVVRPRSSSRGGSAIRCARQLAATRTVHGNKAWRLRWGVFSARLGPHWATSPLCLLLPSLL